tara:strand:- start:307 stop:741 length:435 start_codon:yes stop_codon:yes gene_type:complete
MYTRTGKDKEINLREILELDNTLTTYEQIGIIQKTQNALAVYEGRLIQRIVNSLQKGDIVQWQGKNNEHVIGEIEKKNPKTLHIKQIAIDSYPEMQWSKDNESYKMFPQMWKVSPQLVRELSKEQYEEIEKTNTTKCIHNCCNY